MMTPERWQRVKDLLGPALELDPAKRAGYLDQACGADPTLRPDLERLLAAEEKAGPEFLSDPVILPELTLDLPQQADAWVGRRLGPYQIVEEIGTGGMGEVYRAVRADDEYHKEVAIKLVRSGQDSSFVLSRFKTERQILANLDHPNIARLLDGGTTQEGVPYFVMELIEGERINEYCDAHKLTTNERLGLFLQVCSAVQYAHQHLVIHRDIKPGNILVNAEGVPKLLDFGIAKILESNEATDQPQQTISMIRLLTPEYASPEQVKGEPITTASDVYSLGVVLYELLTGRTPYNVPTHTPHEISRAVCEIEPDKPSTAVRRKQLPTGDGERKGTDDSVLNAVREGSSEKLGKRLRGDLDNIVLMALRKEPQRRYASVEQFAQDIRRHLEHLPVFARKDTAGYRASKFIARHKAGVAAAALVAVALLAAMGVTLREASIADRRFNDVRQLANSLIFDIHDSIQDLPGSTPARKLIVDRALQYLDSLSQESRGDLSLQRELATAYQRVGLVQGHYLQNSLGDTQGSLISYQKALKIREQILSRSRDWNDRLALAESQRLVANQQWATGQYSEAVKNIVSAVATSEALNGTNPKNAKVLQELEFDYKAAGLIYGSDYAGRVGDPDKGRESNRKALATDEALLAINPNDPDIQHAYANDLNRFGGTLDDDPKAALEYYYKQLEIEQKLYQRSQETRYARGIANAYSHIGQTYDGMGDTGRSLENNAKGLEVSKELVRVDPKNTYFQQALAIAYANTADDLGKGGQVAQSQEYIENGLKIMKALVASAPENRQQRGYFAKMVQMKGLVFLKLDKPEAAMKEFAASLSLYESLYKTDPNGAKGVLVDAADCRKRMGEAASRLGNSSLAADYFLKVLNFVEPVISKQKPDPAVLYLAADSYSGLGDLELQKARQSHHDPAKQRERWIAARSWYLKSLDAWHRIEHPRPNAFDAGDPAEVAKSLQLCEAALSPSN
jgi:eukaryotic-like serine/threonine-protein kinase